MFRKRTINSCLKKLKSSFLNSKIEPNNPYYPKMDLLYSDDRQIIFSGNKKYIYVFDTFTHHELYSGDAKRFEIIIYKKGKTEPCAYINLDNILIELLGSNKINYDLIKLKNLIAEWLYTFSNTYVIYYTNFEKVSFDLYLQIRRMLSKKMEKEFKLE